jgi:single-stranded DNA-binding protein
MSFNKITMVGNLGRDPELRRLSSGHAVWQRQPGSAFRFGENALQFALRT